MPLFALYGLDKPGALEVRKETRQAHLNWVASLAPRVKIAGPMLADDGATPIGSIMVIEADNLEDAKAEYARDPYNAAGLWQSTSIRPFNWVVKQ